MKTLAAIIINVLLFLPVFVAKEYEVINKPLYNDIIYVLTVILICLVVFAFRKTVLYLINFCSPEGRLKNLKTDICELEERLKHQNWQTPGYHYKCRKLAIMKNKLKEQNGK